MLERRRAIGSHGEQLRILDGAEAGMVDGGAVNTALLRMNALRRSRRRSSRFDMARVSIHWQSASISASRADWWRIAVTTSRLQGPRMDADRNRGPGVSLMAALPGSVEPVGRRQRRPGASRSTLDRVCSLLRRLRGSGGARPLVHALHRRGARRLLQQSRDAGTALKRGGPRPEDAFEDRRASRPGECVNSSVCRTNALRRSRRRSSRFDMARGSTSAETRCAPGRRHGASRWWVSPR